MSAWPSMISVRVTARVRSALVRLARCGGEGAPQSQVLSQRDDGGLGASGGHVGGADLVQRLCLGVPVPVRPGKLQDLGKALLRGLVLGRLRLSWGV